MIVSGLHATVLRRGRGIAHHTSPGCAQFATLLQWLIWIWILRFNGSLKRSAEVSQPDVRIVSREFIILKILIMKKKNNKIIEYNSWLNCFGVAPRLGYCLSYDTRLCAIRDTSGWTIKYVSFGWMFHFLRSAKVSQPDVRIVSRD